MDPLLTLAIALYAVNAVLFGVLAFIFGRTAYATRAAYPIGLFIFSILLFGHALGTSLGYTLFSEYLGSQAFPFMSIMGAFEFVGALALLRITL
jgi:hypothetical protein